MRPLNRPMFRYGGPIKEGIMQGMKNGGLANNEGPRRAALVGNSIFPKDAEGRSKHFLQFALPALATAGRFALTRGIPAALRAFGKTQRTGLGRTRVTSPNILGRDPLFGLIPKGIQAGMGRTSKGLISKGARLIASPSGALITAGTLTDILPGGRPFGPDKFLPNILGQRFDEQGNKIPGTGLFNPDSGIKTTGEGEIIRGGKTTKVVPGGEVEAGTGKESAAEKAKLNEDRIQETKNKYYKMMGIDKMNKEAVYDSLIDASKIIQEEGGDLKGSVKSGTLQNRLIQAIGKNLDKSADLKKAIDSAVLKGEIQKDINLTKPSAFAEQVQFIRNNPNDPLARKISGLTSVADDLAGVKTGELTSDLVARQVGSKGTAVTDVVKDDKYQTWAKKNENKDEIDYVQENLKGIDDGLYIINKKAIQIQTIDGKKVASPLDLDSIIG
jgi:hypothetical protein